MDKPTKASLDRYAELCQESVISLLARGFTQPESIQLTCALVQQHNVHLTQPSIFMNSPEKGALN